MELDALQSAWRDHANRIDALETSHRQLLVWQLQRRFATTRWRLMAGPVADLVSGVAAMGLSMNFLADHWSRIGREPLGAVPSLVVVALAVAVMVASGFQLAALTEWHTDAPLLETRRILNRVGLLRARSIQWMLGVGLGFWFVPLLAAAQWVAGFDLYRVLTAVSQPWLFSNLALAVIGPLALLRWLPKALGATKLRGLHDILAGAEVAKARREVDEVASWLS